MRRRAQSVDDGEGDGRQAAGDRERYRRGDHRGHRRDEEQDDQDEGARVGVMRLQQQRDDQRPGDAVEGFGEDEFQPPRSDITSSGRRSRKATEKP